MYRIMAEEKEVPGNKFRVWSGFPSLRVAEKIIAQMKKEEPYWNDFKLYVEAEL